MKFHSSILAPRYAKSHSIFGIEENLAGSYSEIMSRDRSEIRRKAFVALIDGRDRSRWPTQNALAEYLNLSPAHVTQMKSGNRPIGNDSADKIERGFIEDDREEHRTDPRTLWFVSQNNYGVKIKVMFVIRGSEIYIKSAYRATDTVSAMYDRKSAKR